MALVNGGFLHYTDMNKFIKNLLLRNRLSDFEIISQECDPYIKQTFKKKKLIHQKTWLLWTTHFLLMV